MPSRVRHCHQQKTWWGRGAPPGFTFTFFSHGVYASPTRHLRHTNPSVSLLLAAPEGDPSVAGLQQGPEADRAVRERLCEDLRSREGSSGRHLRGCVNGTRAKLRSHGSEKLQGRSTEARGECEGFANRGAGSYPESRIGRNSPVSALWSSPDQAR